MSRMGDMAASRKEHLSSLASHEALHSSESPAYDPDLDIPTSFAATLHSYHGDRVECPDTGVPPGFTSVHLQL